MAEAKLVASVEERLTTCPKPTHKVMLIARKAYLIKGFTTRK
jgi:hypothetical protein